MGIDLAESSSLTHPTVTGTPATRAGQKLRQIRERLSLTLRTVEEASLEIADSEGSSEYVVSTGRLNQVENDGSLPSIYKLYSLATIYRLGIEEVLGLYGINTGKMEGHRARTHQARTHRFTAELGDPARLIRFPVRFDPGLLLAVGLDDSRTKLRQVVSEFVHLVQAEEARSGGDVELKLIQRELRLCRFEIVLIEP